MPRMDMVLIACVFWITVLSTVVLSVQDIGKGFSFKTCTNSGPHGPTQHQCNTAYQATQVEVQVLNESSKPPWSGVQVWTVPETTQYSITALGASGGSGVANPEPSKGAYAHAKFNFTKGEKIYLLIGQAGSSACSSANKDSKPAQICRNGTKNNDLGGGGGGGGTYVFKIDAETGEVVALIVAGGGGGMSVMQGRSVIRSDGGLGNLTGNGHGAITTPNGPGGGGGWYPLTGSPTQAGRSPQIGGRGGQPCVRAQEMGWLISGGFGGGGGGCSAGGGGGGYTGGNVSVTDNKEHNGQGGLSYVHPNGTSVRVEPGAHRGPAGEVEIAFVIDCPCEFMCIFKDFKNQDYKCYCAPNHILAPDNIHCINPASLKNIHPTETIPTVAIIGIAGICFVSFVGVALYCGYCVIQRRQKRQGIALERHLNNPDYQLDRLRSTNTTSTMMTEYNPNYDFGDAKYTIQDLHEIPRDNLSFVKALGQGAFGEVYQGTLTNMAEEGDPTLRVAVKTLPALCTDQAEMDFLMEALIMSKFQHPNIVRFIGVCFEKHPRYIILELLEGGDLKTFLRESRPKPGRPSRVTMLDLVKLSLDVAKGCQYLEENRFIHRDIAARNCLLTTKDSNRVAKIADFGMARDIYRADYYRKGGKAMLPVKWMPPEAFLDGFFSSKTDVWSFGILLWEVFSMGHMPYPGCGNHEVMQLVTAGGRLEPPSNCPKPIYQIMKICSHGVPERRPNFATIIEMLQQCLQDPDVIHSPLPVFQHPAAIERHNSLSVPGGHQLSGGALISTLSYQTQSGESTPLVPDTPSSLMPLIGPQSPAVDLTLESDGGYARGRGITNYRGSDIPNTTGNVFTYDCVDEQEEEHLEPLMNHIEPALGHNTVGPLGFEPTSSFGSASASPYARHDKKKSVIGNRHGMSSIALDSEQNTFNASDSFPNVFDSASAPHNCSTPHTSHNKVDGGIGVAPDYSNINAPRSVSSSKLSMASNPSTNSLPWQGTGASSSTHLSPHNNRSSPKSNRISPNKELVPVESKSSLSLHKLSQIDADLPQRQRTESSPVSHANRKYNSSASLSPKNPSPADTALGRAQSHSETLDVAIDNAAEPAPLYVNTQVGNNKSMSALSQIGRIKHNPVSSKSASVLSKS